MSAFRPRLPGIIASLLLMLFVSFWTYWSFGEFYYEGWGTRFPQPLAYLIPCAISVVLAAATIRWPRVMGAAIIVISALFYGWVMTMNIGRWGFSWPLVLSWAGIASLSVLAGVLFIVDGRQRARASAAAPGPVPGAWWRRHVRPLTVFGVPAIIALAFTAIQLPENLGRYDDGDRGARVIEGNGVRLTWAPAGPGWNWQQPWGGYPSWDSLAFYGTEPVGLKTGTELAGRHATTDNLAKTGLCAYLAEDGKTLLEEPVYIWRMPTADEFVRSLTRDGRNAGCAWDGVRGQSACRTEPDKETPLWAPDEQPIYMWTATEQSADNAWYVNYHGVVSSQPKSFGNPRHGYRCVKPVS